MASWSTFSPKSFLVALAILVAAVVISSAVPLSPGRAKTSTPPGCALQDQAHLDLPFNMNVVEGAPRNESDCSQDIFILQDHTGNVAIYENARSPSQGCQWVNECKYDPLRFPYFYQVATATNKNTEQNHCNSEAGLCKVLESYEMVLRRPVQSSTTAGGPSNTSALTNGWAISLEHRPVGFVCRQS
eukprot:scpid88674/ scgid32964/ 